MTAVLHIKKKGQIQLRKIIPAVFGIFFMLFVASVTGLLSPEEGGSFFDNVPIVGKYLSPTYGPPQIPPITSRQTIHAFVTAYDPYDEKCVERYAHVWPRKTPGGDDPETPGAAVDPAVIPYGSTMIIPGMGKFTADDTGRDMRKAARKSVGAFYFIDVRIPAPYRKFNDPNEARKEAHVIAANKGAHWLDVTVIPPGNQ